jgi:hypothetical protein
LLVGALLAGGALAAPLAAWLTQRLDPRTLGTVIGAFIISSNASTLAAVAGVGSTALAIASVVLAATWAAGAAVLVVKARRPPDRVETATEWRVPADR